MPASDDNTNDGLINWADVTTDLGDLAPGEAVSIIVYFTGIADTSQQNAQSPCTINGRTCNVAGSSGPTVTPPTPPGFQPPPTVTLPPKEDAEDVELINPTAVNMVLSNVETGEEGNMVTWASTTEVDTVGFNVLRQIGSEPAQRLNSEMIVARYAGQGSGAIYNFLDTTSSDEDAVYLIEVVTADGTTRIYEIGSANDSSIFIFLPLINS
jgi:hypothetical protein